MSDSTPIDLQNYPVERVPVGSLRPHPRNYREHPEDQLAHIETSIREHGFYRNIVVAEDGTILAGHGVVKAAVRMGLQHVPVRRLPVGPESPAALRVLTGDNEIGHGADINDRLLTELLRDIQQAEGVAGLVGTGYDEASLAALAFVARPPDNVLGKDEASEWVGMPHYDSGTLYPKLVVTFRTPADQTAFIALLEEKGIPVPDRHYKQTKTMWWPPRGRDEKVDALSADIIEG